jgi:hypothetical protein
VLQLVEKSQLKLDLPTSECWSNFKGHGKERLAVRQQLTRYSGLRPGLLPAPPGSGTEAALARIAADTPPYPPEVQNFDGYRSVFYWLIRHFNGSIQDIVVWV